MALVRGVVGEPDGLAVDLGDQAPFPIQAKRRCVLEQTLGVR
jgi:hypothetical protein